MLDLKRNNKSTIYTSVIITFFFILRKNHYTIYKFVSIVISKVVLFDEPNNIIQVKEVIR